MKFVFTLQKILDYKLNRYDIIKKELAYWVSQENKYKILVENLYKEMSEMKKEVFSNILNMNDREYLYQYQSRIQDVIIMHKQKLHELEEPIEEARQKYLNAKKEKEALEYLKDKQYQEWLLYHKKKEIKNINDTNIQRYYYNNKNNI